MYSYRLTDSWPREVNHGNYFIRAYRSHCRTVGFVFQACLAAGADTVGGGNSGSRSAHSQCGIARHGLVARAAIPEIPPCAEPRQMVNAGRQPTAAEAVD